MRGGHHKVARAYVLYRAERARIRREETGAADSSAMAFAQLRVRGASGELQPVDRARLGHVIEEACAGLDAVSPATVMSETLHNLYDGMSLGELALAPIMAARTLVEAEPNYAYVSARLLLDKMRAETLSFVIGTPIDSRQSEMQDRYVEYFPMYVRQAASLEMLDAELLRFDLPRLAAALKPERDLQFQFLGLRNALRSLFPAHQRHAPRAAAGVLHARRDGARRA